MSYLPRMNASTVKIIPRKIFSSSPFRLNRYLYSPLLYVPSYNRGFLPNKSLSTTSSGSKLRSPTLHDIDSFRKLMSEGSVITDPDVLTRYNTDWSGKYKGTSKVLLRPKTTKEVSQILSYCHNEKIGVVPQAGNTGVVGGSVPINDEVILSIEYLNSVDSFDNLNGIISCGSGCILKTLQDKVVSYNHLLPIDLGSKGSCMIGGNISTNAGGQYYYRFGSIHANIIGLEVVLPNGTILDLMSTNRKDNTGYDLKHLFIGSEGTLGVITKVAMSCPRLPQSRNVAFLACPSFDSVLQTLELAKSRLGEILAAFEFMDQEILNQISLVKKIPLIQSKGETGESVNHSFCILIETLGSSNEHDQDKMESFLTECLNSNSAIDGVLAQDLKQIHDIWEIRESCNPIIKSNGYNYKYDLSLPIAEYYDIVEEMRERLSCRPDAIAVNWGHVIDGNLHFNVLIPGKFDVDEELKSLIEPYIFEAVVRRGGSISAEHGLGRCKNQYLGKYAKSPDVVSVMRTLKMTFDPHGILNPGKYLPSIKKS